MYSTLAFRSCYLLIYPLSFIWNCCGHINKRKNFWSKVDFAATFQVQAKTIESFDWLHCEGLNIFIFSKFQMNLWLKIERQSQDSWIYAKSFRCAVIWVTAIQNLELNTNMATQRWNQFLAVHISHIYFYNAW